MYFIALSLDTLLDYIILNQKSFPLRSSKGLQRCFLIDGMAKWMCSANLIFIPFWELIRVFLHLRYSKISWWYLSLSVDLRSFFMPGTVGLYSEGLCFFFFQLWKMLFYIALTITFFLPFSLLPSSCMPGCQTFKLSNYIGSFNPWTFLSDFVFLLCVLRNVSFWSYFVWNDHFFF